MLTSLLEVIFTRNFRTLMEAVDIWQEAGGMVAILINQESALIRHPASTDAECW